MEPQHSDPQKQLGQTETQLSTPRQRGDDVAFSRSGLLALDCNSPAAAAYAQRFTGISPLSRDQFIQALHDTGYPRLAESAARFPSDLKVVGTQCGAYFGSFATRFRSPIILRDGRAAVVTGDQNSGCTVTVYGGRDWKRLDSAIPVTNYGHNLRVTGLLHNTIAIGQSGVSNRPDMLDVIEMGAPSESARREQFEGYSRARILSDRLQIADGQNLGVFVRTPAGWSIEPLASSGDRRSTGFHGDGAAALIDSEFITWSVSRASIWTRNESGSWIKSATICPVHNQKTIHAIFAVRGTTGFATWDNYGLCTWTSRSVGGEWVTTPISTEGERITVLTEGGAGGFITRGSDGQVKVWRVTDGVADCVAAHRKPELGFQRAIVLPEDQMFTWGEAGDTGAVLRRWKNLSSGSLEITKVTTNLSNSLSVSDVDALPDGRLLINKNGHTVVLTPSLSGWIETEVPFDMAVWDYEFSVREDGVIMSQHDWEAIRLG